MEQWINLRRINRFVNLTRLYISWRPASSETKSNGRQAGRLVDDPGGLHLVKPSLTAGRLAGW